MFAIINNSDNLGSFQSHCRLSSALVLPPFMQSVKLAINIFIFSFHSPPPIHPCHSNNSVLLLLNSSSLVLIWRNKKNRSGSTGCDPSPRSGPGFVQLVYVWSLPSTPIQLNSAHHHPPPSGETLCVSMRGGDLIFSVVVSDERYLGLTDPPFWELRSQFPKWRNEYKSVPYQWHGWRTWQREN